MAVQEFQNKTVFVSGAGRGFGRHIAEAFFQQGANLVLTDYNDEMLALALAPYAGEEKRVTGIAGDIGVEQTSIEAAELAKKTFGHLDIAVNNAGIIDSPGRLDTLDSAMAAKVIQVNLMGVFYAMKHQLPLMLNRAENDNVQCNIVNLGSAAGLMGSPKLSIYAASKHGVVGLTRSAALEYARRNIRINAICPAFADTDMAREAINNSHHGAELAEKRLVGAVPMQRLAQIDEIVQAVLWICSARNSFYTGQALSIDGGLTAF